MSVIDKAVEWLINLANDDSHGYSQVNRWGPADYDCSSSTIRAFEQAGLQVRTNGASYTGNMRVAFEKCGFKSIKFNRSMVLKKGDVLLNEKHHVVVYIGDNKVVTASIDEVGTTIGKKPGDQTGKEIYIRSMYVPSYGWDYVLRYEGDSNTNQFPIPTMNLKKDMIGDQIKWLQVELNEALAPNPTLKVDGHFGPATLDAVKKFQRIMKLEVDGIVGKITRNALINNTEKLTESKPQNPYNHIKVTLKKGSKGESVRYLQWELNQQLGMSLAIDGSFGAKTLDAVKKFQKANGLEIDGIVGPKTWAKLDS